ncbi:hypothetical protein [Sphingomonas alba]|uniref:Transposase n=1 Tax=Sphingomonas alba TaxID=2908208 RepID=A0ABT0RK18_9SPHN|nr:hypothetical protein [Sphingomonas alba]MCL6682940.1 hypothetical protein [Sphingomonas alba]
MSHAYPDIVRQWAADREPQKASKIGFATRVAALFARLQPDKLLDVIRVF